VSIVIMLDLREVVQNSSVDQSIFHQLPKVSRQMSSSKNSYYKYLEIRRVLTVAPCEQTAQPKI